MRILSSGWKLIVTRADWRLTDMGLVVFNALHDDSDYYSSAGETR